MAGIIDARTGKVIPGSTVSSGGAPVDSDRLGERLMLLNVSDSQFIFWGRQWRLLRAHRSELHRMAARYPVMVDFPGLRIALHSPAEVDRLILDIRTKLKDTWIRGTRGDAG